MSRLPLVGFAVVLAGLAWLFYKGESDLPPPTPCTCLQLANSPTAYAGKRVKVSTAGTEPGTQPGTLVWWRMAGDPPAVVLRGAIPSPAPPFLTGVCHAPLSGGPVTVTGCRP